MIYVTLWRVGVSMSWFLMDFSTGGEEKGEKTKSGKCLEEETGGERNGLKRDEGWRK